MNLETVIKYIQGCQRTHKESVEWYADGGSFEEWLNERTADELEQEFGDLKFHEQCVKDYSKVLNFLESIKERHDIE